MMAGTLAVIDVCVLVAGLISRQAGRASATASLVELWWAGAIEPVVCPMLLDEFEETLRADRILASVLGIGDFLREIRAR